MLESQLAGATDDAGLWRFKDGAEIYAHKLKLFTTTSMTAAQIHELGLGEVRRIESEMDAILRKLGRTAGTVKDRIERLRSDLSYPGTDEGRARIMADIDAMIWRRREAGRCALQAAAQGAGDRAAISRVPLGQRCGQLHGAPARRIAGPASIRCRCAPTT